jgi:hypothetical protein
MKNNIRVFSMIILAAMFLVLSGCTAGPYQTREENVSGFNSISVETFGEVIIEQGDTESLTIEAPRDFLRYITAQVEDGTLVISTRRGFVGTPVQRVTYTITVKDLQDISLSGAGAIKVHGLTTGDFSVNLSGAGSVEIDQLTADNLDVSLSSAGAIVIAGEVQSQSVNLSGVGSYEAGDLKTASADINLSGAGSAVVWVTNSLDVNVSGIGSVSYYGNPQVSQNISGLGSVNSKGER